jgi:hypothetical protein
VSPPGQVEPQEPQQFGGGIGLVLVLVEQVLEGDLDVAHLRLEQAHGRCLPTAAEVVAEPASHDQDG